jgi:hypothetical protein
MQDDRKHRLRANGVRFIGPDRYGDAESVSGRHAAFVRWAAKRKPQTHQLATESCSHTPPGWSGPTLSG